VEALFEGLYPRVPPSARPAPSVSYTGSWPQVTEEEVVRALYSLINQKSPGPDGIKAQAIKEAWKARFAEARLRSGLRMSAGSVAQGFS
jgi:hypothetical protein